MDAFLFQQHLQQMFLKEQCCDATINICGKTYRLHKVRMIARSLFERCFAD
jgi:hypothetical protein